MNRDGLDPAKSFLGVGWAFPVQADPSVGDMSTAVYEEDIRPDDAKPDALRRTFAHLGVDTTFEPADTGVQRNVRLSDFEMRLRHASPELRREMEQVPEGERNSPRWTISVPEADRHALAEDYRPEVERLEELLGRRMPWGTAG